MTNGNIMLSQGIHLKVTPAANPLLVSIYTQIRYMLPDITKQMYIILLYLQCGH